MQAEKASSETTIVEEHRTKQIVLKKEEEPKESKKHYLALKLPKRVTWSEDTVDNENMGKKKSNICCIYHRPKLSPDDPDTSSCDSCDEKGKNAYERPNHYNRESKHHHDAGHGNCLKK